MSEEPATQSPVSDDSSSPRIKIHNFNARYSPDDATRVFFQLISLDKSFFLWVGTNRPSLDSLSVSMMTNYSAIPSTTTLMGLKSDFAADLAKRLAARTKQAVYLSYNIEATNELIEDFVEARISEEWRKLFPPKTKTQS